MRSMLRIGILFLMSSVAILGKADVIPDLNLFNHLGVGAHVGTTGFGFEAATPITKFVSVRAGITIMPGISFNTEVDGSYELPSDNKLSQYGISQDFTMDVKGSLSRAQGSLIFNVYPLTDFSSFYVAAGGYFGGSKIVGITGHSDELKSLADNASIEIGDYLIPVDKNGNVEGALKVSGFRPYLGLGFGRPVPKGRLNFGVELGVQFMGKMKIYSGDDELSKMISDNDDDWQKWMDKLTVYPVLKFTLSGKIF